MTWSAVADTQAQRGSAWEPRQSSRHSVVLKTDVRDRVSCK